MSDTKIEWTDTTWNPIAGCSIVSSGCKNCYAMQMAKRLDAMGVEKYKGLTETINDNTVWNGIIRLDESSLQNPYRWKKRRTVFVNSMSDLFHPDVPIEFIKKVWKVMKETPRHNYQILTKRPERMLEVLNNHNFKTLPNVWLGTSVENHKVVHRIDFLRFTPAEIRFISFEPLIGSVGNIDLSYIDWAIVGGESGHKARPMKVEWIDEIHEQCIKARTAFFFKQWGSWGADNKKRSKQANGRVYKKQHWNEMPIKQ